MIQAILPLIGGLTSLASEFIEDPDKRLEFETRKQEIQNELLLALVQQETNPWVDGTVKILTALVALARPLASIGVFVYSAIDPSYLSVLKQIDPTLALGAGAAAFGAAPLWGLSRHQEKVAKAKQPAWEH
jgi:hypothetical protein